MLFLSGFELYYRWVPLINIAETEILTSSYRLTANTLALSYFTFCRHQFGFCHAFSFKVNDFRRGSRIN